MNLILDNTLNNFLSSWRLARARDSSNGSGFQQFSRAPRRYVRVPLRCSISNTAERQQNEKVLAEECAKSKQLELKVEAGIDKLTMPIQLF